MPTSTTRSQPDVVSTPNPLVRGALLAAQLAVLSLLVTQTRVTTAPFVATFPFVAAGAFVQGLLPEAYRRYLFLVLSAGIVIYWFGPLPAIALFAVGSALIGICHIPVALWKRVVMLVAAGGLLALYRAGASFLPALSREVALMIPVLGSMFMFRIAVYLYDTESGDVEVEPVDRLNYFFMLPNALFLLFPIVDYATFCSSYKPSERWRVQQEGITWIVEGVIHLLVLRAVQMWVVRDARHLDTNLDCLLYVLSAYLLYLRVSGHFHIIIGVLKLFGYDLPRTHNRFVLAAGFTDVWRRMNIYWTTFISKMVYYPCLSRFRRLGGVKATMLSVTAVFTATVLFHAYQTFWLSGSFEITMSDLLFWIPLGGLVMVGLVLEKKKKRTLRKKDTPADIMKRVAKTIATLTCMVLLWSLWASSLPLAQWLDAVAGIVK